LPLPDAAAPAISTCLRNVVAKDASGSADCSTGAVELLDLPLSSEVFLDGDLLPTRCVGGSTPGAPCCGCAAPTACPGGGTCTNDTGRCRGTTSKSATDKAKQTHVFCGQCAEPNTLRFKTPPCAGTNTDCACTSDDDCADEGTFTSCEQRSAGAFTQVAMARTITETGTPAGAVTTGGPGKASTLVSVFCVPPSGVVAVDAISGLPGPGAVALPGKLVALP